MRNIAKKFMIAGTVSVLAFTALTACTKTEEKADVENAVEAEDLPKADVENTVEAEDLPKTDGGNAVEAENLPQPERLDGATPHYIAREDYDLYGDICEVGDMQFTVTEITIEKDETGGSEVMVGVADGSDGTVPKITVIYDENTKLIKQVIRDGGASHKEKEGTAADLQKGFTAEMMGSYEGDIFHATEILIVEVVW